MTNDRLKAGRLKAGLTQNQAAEALGVSQSYLSQLEMGQRPVTPELARAATALYRLSATALPIPEPPTEGHVVDAAQLARELAGLGYPGFGHLRPCKANPAAVVLEALLQNTESLVQRHARFLQMRELLGEDEQLIVRNL